MIFLLIILRFFAKGHLTPNADFQLESWRDVTFMFVNVQPQWQEINGGNWEQVEQATRFNAAAVSGCEFNKVV